MRVPIEYLPAFDEKQLSVLNTILARLGYAVNAIEFGDGLSAENIFCSFATVDTPASATQSFKVAHSLGKSAIGIIPIWKNKAADFYYADATSAWDTNYIYLKCDTESTSAVLLII